MSGEYDIGDLAEVDLTLSDLDGDPTNATSITLKVRRPDGTVDTYTFGDGGTISNPSTGVYTARINLTAAGRWDYRWETDEPQSAEEGMLMVREGAFSADPPQWRPSLAQVGSISRSRTRVPMGEEQGTFTDETRPTADEVQTLIERQAVPRVASRLSTVTTDCELNADLIQRATDLAALFTSMLIELSYYPEQVSEGNSPYGRYKELWDEDMKSFLSDVEDFCNTSIEGEGSGAMPSGDFSTSTAPLGREIVW